MTHATFLEIHHAAVRGNAAKDYPASVVEAWARTPTVAPVSRSMAYFSILARRLIQL